MQWGMRTSGPARLPCEQWSVTVFLYTDRIDSCFTFTQSLLFLRST